MAVVNIISYVETLDSAVRDKLYESSWTCQAMLRSLQPLAKQYVLRLLWVDRPVAKGGRLQRDRVCRALDPPEAMTSATWCWVGQGEQATHLQT